MSNQQAENDAKTKPPEATQAELGGARGPFYQQSNHDKLASDRYGEELNHNASIWRMYAEEAKGQDAESVRKRNENLNNLLLFATLFSAIVTAFIIESTSLLQQDSSEVSTQLLLALLQSQRRIETGTPDLAPLPIEIPAFKPSSTARLINVLWLTSLMVSLGAAVVAILAKEWLMEFLTYETRHAHDYALERQNRLANQRAWNVLPIIDLLPTLLNFALFLFAVGLIIRLWILDFVVAGVTTVISVGVGGVYFSFVACGALFEACPYDSQISLLSRKWIPNAILKYLNKDVSAASRNKGCVEQKDLELLSWLLKDSWDPVLNTYVTQALAGLKTLRLAPEVPSDATIKKDFFHNFPSYTNRGLDIRLLFQMGAYAVDQLEALPTKGANELALNGGSSATRLAIALSEIYPYARATLLNISEAQGHSSTQDDKSSPARRITDRVFDALDSFWAENSPALTPIAYAHLATAELKMLRLDLATMILPKAKIPANPRHTSVDMPPSKLAQGGDAAVSPATATTPGSAAATATVPKGTSAPAKTHEGISEPIHVFWERYSRALTRTALVIKSALSYVEINSNQELQCSLFDLLLQARMLIEEAGIYHIEFWRRIVKSTWNYPEVSIRFISEKNTIQRVGYRREKRNFELFESLVGLCGSYNITDNLRLEGFQVAAFQLLVVFWVDYFRKWMHNWQHPDYVKTLTSWIVDLNQVVPQTPPYNQRTSADIVNHQYILLAHIAYTLAEFGSQSSKSDLPSSQDKVIDLVLDLVISKLGTLVNAEEKFKSYSSNEDTRPNYQWIGKMEVKDWVDRAVNLSTWHGSENSARRNRGHKLCWCTLRVVELASALIYDLMPAITQGSKVETLLDFIHGALRSPGRDITSPIIRNFLDKVTSIIKLDDSEKEYFVSDRGFYILTKVGQVETDRIAVAWCVYRILDRLHVKNTLVGRKVILSLLEAASYVWDPEVAKDTEFSGCYPYIVPNILFQLERLSGDKEPISYFVTDASSSIQVLLNGVKNWVRDHSLRDHSLGGHSLLGSDWDFNPLPPTNPAILAPLQKQFQRRIDMGQPPWGIFSSDKYGAEYYEPDYKRFPKDQEPQKSIISPQDPAKSSGSSAAPDFGVRAQSDVGATSHAASSRGAPEGTGTGGVVGEASNSEQVLHPQTSGSGPKSVDTDGKSETPPKQS